MRFPGETMTFGNPFSSLRGLSQSDRISCVTLSTTTGVSK